MLAIACLPSASPDQLCDRKSENLTLQGDGNATGGDLESFLGEGELDASTSAYSNYIYSASLFPVGKADALQYLDQGGSKPARHAKVIVIRGANSPPDVAEYKVCFVALLAWGLPLSTSHN